MDRAFDEIGTVRGDVHLDIFRQQGLKIGHHLSHRLRDCQRVAIGGPDDPQPDSRLAIRPQHRRAGFRTQCHLRHVSKFHVACNCQCLDLFDRPQRCGGAYLQALAFRTQRPRRAVEGRIAKDRAQIGQCQAPRRHLHQVDIHPEGQFPVSEDLDVGHAGGRQQPTFGNVAHQGRKLIRRASGRGDRDAQDCIGIRVRLHHPWGISLDWKRVFYPGNRVSQVGRRHVQIDVVPKLDRHPA